MISGIAMNLPVPGSGDERSRIKESAGQFEALLIAQMLRSAREESAGGWTGASEDNSSASMMEMSEQHIAQMLAAQGGLGLAKMIVDGLSREVSSALKEGDARDSESSGTQTQRGIR
jgi:Rod binding domain-containing protein